MSTACSAQTSALHRRPAIEDAADLHDVARVATRLWYKGLCDATLQQRGVEESEHERVMTTLQRRGSIDMAEQHDFLARLDEPEREHWDSLCEMGVISPWDAVVRQQRYLLNAKRACEENLREQQAKLHKQHCDELAKCHAASAAAPTKAVASKKKARKLGVQDGQPAKHATPLRARA